MFITKLAFNNLKYNLKRTISLILLLVMSTTAIILYQGYVEYCREGMATGYINSSGHLQIANKSYWEGSEETDVNISDNELTLIYDLIKEFPQIKFYDSVLDFGGLVGNNNNSAVFWGKGYDHPDKYYGACKGIPVFEGDEQILIGKNLAKKLNFDLEDENTSLSFMCNSPDAGICLGSLEVQGFVDTGIPQNDSGLVITTRQVAMDLLDLDNTASFIQLYFSDNNIEQIKKELQNRLALVSKDLIIKDWMELNPSYKQVNDMNEAQFFLISIMIGILVIISIMQTLSTAFLERMGEFGTLEAIGMKKLEITIMLFCEILYMFIISGLIAYILCLCVNKITSCFNLSMTPPGYDVSYPLYFLLVPKKMILSFCFVFICCISASCYPVIYIYKNSAIKLIHRK